LFFVYFVLYLQGNELHMDLGLCVYPESTRGHNVSIADIPTLFSGCNSALFSNEIVARADKDKLFGHTMLKAGLDYMTTVGSYTLSEFNDAAALKKGRGHSANLFAEGEQAGQYGFCRGTLCR